MNSSPARTSRGATGCAHATACARAGTTSRSPGRSSASTARRRSPARRTGRTSAASSSNRRRRAGDGLSGAKRGAAWALDEPGLEQQRHDGGLADGLAVEALDREAPLARAAEILDQGCEGLAEPSLLGIAQRNE